MTTKKIILSDCNDFPKVVIGRKGEFGVTELIFDCSEFNEKYGEGTAQIVHSINGSVYIVPSEQDGAEVSWTISASDTTETGTGSAEIRWCIDGGLKKSVTIITIVQPAIEGVTGDAPEEVTDWITLATALYNQLMEIGVSEEQIEQGISNYLEAHPIEGLTEEEADTLYQPIGNYLTEHQDISGKANVGASYTKAESNARYLTEHQDISGKANVGDSYTKVESDNRYASQTVLNGKQDKLIAGNNITISADGKTISASGGGSSYDDTALSSRVSEIEGKESVWDAKAELTDIPTADISANTSARHTHSNKDVLDEISSEKVSSWDGKSTFSGNYNDLTNKPNIPTVPTSEISANTNARHSHSNKTVLDDITSDKVSEWNGKSTFSGSYNDLTNKPTIPTIPEALKNPYALTINGTVYDGSEAKEVTIEGGGGGSAEWTLLEDTTIESDSDVSTIEHNFGKSIFDEYKEIHVCFLGYIPGSENKNRIIELKNASNGNVKYIYNPTGYVAFAKANNELSYTELIVKKEFGVITVDVAFPSSQSYNVNTVRFSVASGEQEVYRIKTYGYGGSYFYGNVKVFAR